MSNLTTAAKVYEAIIFSAKHDAGQYLFSTSQGPYWTKPGAKINNQIDQLTNVHRVIGNPTNPRVVLLVDKDTMLVWGVQYDGRLLCPDTSDEVLCPDEVSLSVRPGSALVELVQKWEDLRTERAREDDEGESDADSMRRIEDAQLELSAQITDHVFDWFKRAGLVHQ